MLLKTIKNTLEIVRFEKIICSTWLPLKKLTHFSIYVFVKSDELEKNSIKLKISISLQ